MSLIERKKSIIPACDVDIEKFEEIVRATKDIDGVGAYKIGFSLGLRQGLPAVVELARKYTDKPIIYDHQKAGTDIPNTGLDYMDIMKEAGVDSVILFPQAGPVTEQAWIQYAQERGIHVIVGGLMTHESYNKADGGFICDHAIMKMYTIAAELGVSDFVVPGNKPDKIKLISDEVSKFVNPTFYAPGFVAQGGKISDAAEAAGDKWHAIVGRGIYKAEDIEEAAINLTKEL